MNFRQSFSHGAWWGKIIGALFGYMAAGPAGAFFGILIGNFFDKGLFLHDTRPHWHYHAEKRKSVQKIFFDATFSVMGLIAKADGRVSEHEIHLAKTLMQEMQLNAEQIKSAQFYFNEGKKPEFHLNQVIIRLRSALHDNPQLLKLFIDIQYRAANVDGLSAKKQHILNTILKTMGFAPLPNQYRFYDDYASDTSYQGNASSNHQKQHGHRSYGTLDHAYALLNVTHKSTQTEIKRAYRRLMSLNHPDKLVAKGLPEQMLKIATEKTQAISKAYQQICESRGW
ncbi:MAG: co-chaperone DjlA [Legionellales bacterium]|nr:co-chaperone DjlA [Legionellales bacterium]